MTQIFPTIEQKCATSRNRGLCPASHCRRASPAWMPMRAIQTFGSAMYRASREERGISIETSARAHTPQMETIFCEMIQEKAI